MAIRIKSIKIPKMVQIQVDITVFPSPIETPEEASVGPAPEQLVARYAHNIIITGIIISSLFPPESSFQQNHNPK